MDRAEPLELPPAPHKEPLILPHLEEPMEPQEPQELQAPMELEELAHLQDYLDLDINHIMPRETNEPYE